MIHHHVSDPMVGDFCHMNSVADLVTGKPCKFTRSDQHRLVPESWTEDRCQGLESPKRAPHQTSGHIVYVTFKKARFY